MPTIQYLSEHAFLINGTPKQRGKYEVVVIGNEVGIRMVGRDGWVKGCELQPVANYNSGIFPTVSAFISFVQNIMFL